ncbi:sporulation protein [Oceanobacillus piezotolerans]|uniref:Sporulation protein n=1 Tax=Oceanobacillus piezotolerans TaxID=2448030 RepID=A0A498DB16_9BACI|nr:sporulation protein [Oceanobacillus piezotolerans]RLL44933.1 sporulation protein [Oceanobacillus piezotolerans]
MDKTLRYLRESLSNYSENEVCRQILEKLRANQYAGEKQFVDDLSESEMEYLDNVLDNELNYAKNVENDLRVQELTEVYELLF